MHRLSNDNNCFVGLDDAAWRATGFIRRDQLRARDHMHACFDRVSLMLSLYSYTPGLRLRLGDRLLMRKLEDWLQWLVLVLH